MMRGVAGLCLLLWLGVSPAMADQPYTNRYDGCIKSSVRHWWPAGPDATWWKAQLIQESGLHPDAQSPVGARGLAQFMPGTWSDVTKAMGWGLVSRADGCRSAEAGAYYMARLHRVWRAPRSLMSRHRLSQASYNAGAGHIIKAQRLCNGARDWQEIKTCLPQVTGRHSRETINYVDRIGKIQTRLKLWGW